MKGNLYEDATFLPNGFYAYLWAFEHDNNKRPKSLSLNSQNDLI